VRPKNPRKLADPPTHGKLPVLGRREMEPVSWSVVIQASEWLGRAIKAAKNKDQQRFARLIEHVGTIVAGLRALDREAHRLFLPLIYGDVSNWPAEQRRHWADDLVALAHEDRITPAIRVSLAALNNLGHEQKNSEVRQLVEELSALLRVPRGVVSRDSLNMFIDSNVTGSFDFVLGTELDPILEALANPGQSNSRAIRATAAMFVYGVAEEVQQSVLIRSDDRATVAYRYRGYRRPPPPILASSDSPESFVQEGTHILEIKPSTNPITTLRPYADHAEAIFGQLLALQNRVFPSLPTPVWVWS
jgi:hypothetical protein